MNGQYICKIGSYWSSLVKGIWQPSKANTIKTALKICTTNSKTKKKIAAVEKELLSTIEGIYTQFSNLCVQKKLRNANQPVFTIAYQNDLKLY